MDSSNPPNNTEVPKPNNKDLISNLPTHVTDHILKRLPLRKVAQTSVLSRKWRQIWLAHRYLVFDEAFWKTFTKNYDWQKMSNIISNVLFHHNGPIHKFLLFVPKDSQGISLKLSPWLSFLSKTSTKKIILLYRDWYCQPLPSLMFACKDLVKLTVDNCDLSRPPFDFQGFANLRSLELIYIRFKHEDIFANLIASCPRLTKLTLQDWEDLRNLVIDVPSLEHLTIRGVFQYLACKNVLRLLTISLYIEEMEQGTFNPETVDVINVLAKCELEEIYFRGQMCKFFGAGSVIKWDSLAFNNLNKLYLTEVNLGNFEEFTFTVGMLHSCPFIKHLKISVIPNRSDVQHKFEYNESYKLGHLLKVEITGITGSNAELMFIKFILAMSVMLEVLAFKCGNLDAISELKESRELMGLPRGSTKARLLCMEQ